MFAVIVIAAFTCVGALLVGQLTMWICGARSWSWLSPALGLGALILLCVPAIHLPGRAATTFALAVLAVLAGAVLLAAKPAHRPPLGGLIGGAPAFVLGLFPFLSAGRAGTLGVSFDNDMAVHLGWAEAYRSASIAKALPFDDTYPLGTHALVGTLSKGLGTDIELCFAGATLAVPVMLAWTGQGVLVRSGLLGRLVTGALVGMPFFIAGYYGQGSFKEIEEALFVLAFTLGLVWRDELTGLRRWIPLALVVAGAISVYSFTGAIWPIAILLAWAFGLLGIAIGRRQRLGPILAACRAELTSIAIGSLALVVALVPQLPRQWRFFLSVVQGGGLALEPGGNLAGRIPVWPALGAWDNPDYRLPPLDAFATGMWTALFLAVTFVATAWWLRRGKWLVPTAAAVVFLLWVLSDRSEPDYYAAKSLVVLAPFVFVLIAPMLFERDWRRPAWWVFAALPLTVVITVKALDASTAALRYSKVGPLSHTKELRSLRPTLGADRTLFLGDDDFIRWELAGVPVEAPVIGRQLIGTRPEKPWKYGDPLDLDSVDEATMDKYRWIITTRDPAGSLPLPGLRHVRDTRSYSLYERTRPVASATLLPEGAQAAAKLDCATPKGRAIVRAGGRAVLRDPPVAVAVPPIAPGQSASVVLPRLPAGTWDLSAPYNSEHGLVISAPGLTARLPANLDRPGPRYRIGRLDVAAAGDVRVQIHVTTTSLASSSAVAYVNQLIATHAGASAVVPIRRACGRFVDHVLTGGKARRPGG